jgi:carbon monoxide dehydrogenase subunit G
VASEGEGSAVMRVARDLEIAVPPPAVWAVLWDVPRMAACLPGCTEAREVEPHRRYEARMTQRVGPITLSVPLEVTVRDVVAPASLALEARGRDGALGASVAMSVTLAVAARDAGSRVRVEAQGKILGKLGALGHGVIQRKAEELIDEFGARLRRAAEG